jgi:tetratricopeptide (TPR) repeat protein
MTIKVCDFRDCARHPARPAAEARELDRGAADYRIPRITALLGVLHVLQGSVRKHGSQLRIAAQLLDENGVQIWAKTFDRELRDVFEVQSEVAAAVARTVAAELAPAAPRAHVPDLAAYENFLVGREKLHRRDVIASIEALERAVELDPQFAEAWAELAIAQTIDSETTADMDRAREYIDRALALEPASVADTGGARPVVPAGDAPGSGGCRTRAESGPGAGPEQE